MMNAKMGALFSPVGCQTTVASLALQSTHLSSKEGINVSNTFNCISVLVNQLNQVVLRIGIVVTFVVKKMNFVPNMAWEKCKEFL